MNYKIARSFVSVLFAIAILAMVLINVIPKGNFISGPIITLFVYFPLNLFNIFILIRVWRADKYNTKALNFCFYSSLSITIIIIYFFVNFLNTTT